MMESLEVLQGHRHYLYCYYYWIYSESIPEQYLNKGPRGREMTCIIIQITILVKMPSSEKIIKWEKIKTANYSNNSRSIYLQTTSPSMPFRVSRSVSNMDVKTQEPKQLAGKVQRKLTGCIVKRYEQQSHTWLTPLSSTFLPPLFSRWKFHMTRSLCQQNMKVVLLF